jgi:hypothetical protein
MDKKYGVFSSSVDPQKLSMTIRGVLKMLVPVAMSLAPFLSVDPADLRALFDSFEGALNSVDTLIAAGLGAWGAIEAIVGAGRKIAVKFKK